MEEMALTQIPFLLVLLPKLIVGSSIPLFISETKLQQPSHFIRFQMSQNIIDDFTNFEGTWGINALEEVT